MLTRTLLFFVALIAVALGVDTLAQQPGSLVLNWHGWTIETTAAFFVVTLGIVLLLFFLAARAFVWLELLPKRLAARINTTRHENALTALSDSMADLSIGEAHNALKNAKKAKKALPNLPLADTILAQATAAAQPSAISSQTQAIATYSKLLENKHTNSAGLKGLLQISLEQNDSERALTYAQELHQKTPKNTWVMAVLTDLYSRSYRYEEAAEMARKLAKKPPQEAADMQALEGTLGLSFGHNNDVKLNEQLKNLKQKHDENAKFLQACNLLEACKEKAKYTPASAEGHMQRQQVQKQVRALLKTVPDFAPAALFFVDVAVQDWQQGEKKPLTDAKNLLKKTYHQAPVYALADRWLDVLTMINPDGTKGGGMKKTTLLKEADKFIGPWEESLLGLTVKGKAFIWARQWSKAHEVLTRAVAKGEDKTLFETLAQLEKHQHPAGGGAIKWLERALKAPQNNALQGGYIQQYEAWRAQLAQKRSRDDGGKLDDSTNTHQNLTGESNTPQDIARVPQLQHLKNKDKS